MVKKPESTSNRFSERVINTLVPFDYSLKSNVFSRRCGILLGADR